MDIFVVDNQGDNELLNKNEYARENTFVLDKIEKGATKEYRNTCNEDQHEQNGSDDDDDDDDDDEDDGDYGVLPPNTIDISHIIKLPDPKPKDEIDIQMEKFCNLLKSIREKPLEKKTKRVSLLDEEDDLGRTNVEKELKNCKTIGIEQQKTLANPSEKTKKRLDKIERSKTKGKHWYDMPATEVTEELQRDMEIIQMRSVLDPKHFYKKNDLKVLPKFFQVGTVQSSPLDYYNERGERKTKKKTIVDELMADAEFQRFNKRKYKETLDEKRRGGYHKAHKKMKKLKKKS